VIYVACVDRIVRYVGSTTRGIEVRIREHVRDREKAGWDELWLVSLQHNVSRRGVLLAEEKVGKLLKPDQNRRPPGR
jgi:Uri superfamily endonuclease